MIFEDDFYCTECEETSKIEIDVEMDLDEFNQPYVIGEKECPRCGAGFEVTAQFDVYFE